MLRINLPYNIFLYVCVWCVCVCMCMAGEPGKLQSKNKTMLGHVEILCLIYFVEHS